MTKISMKGRYRCHGLFARFVWQELFNIYRSNDGDLSNMDNMLCDLYTLTQEFEKYKSFTLYWGFDGEYTYITSFLNALNENVVKIEWDIDKYEVTISPASTIYANS